MDIGIVGMGTKTPHGNGLDTTLWKTMMTSYDTCASTICLGEKNQPFGFVTTLPSDIRNGFDLKFWGMMPAQVRHVNDAMHSSLFVLFLYVNVRVHSCHIISSNRIHIHIQAAEIDPQILWILEGVWDAMIDREC